jgi:hypothetical protein
VKPTEIYSVREKLMNSGAVRWVLTHLNDWTWLIAEYRGWLIALAFSAAIVTICSLLHFSDLRWLPPSQRGAAHLSAPGGLFSFAKPIVAVVNSVADVPAEFQATQIAVHTAIAYAFLALAAFLLVAITWRRARRADIRQLVREEIRRSASGQIRE